MKPVLDNLLWIEDLLPLGYEAVPKHGGMAYYIDMKLVLILVENGLSTYEHKGVSYPFQIWNGCILPVEYKKQSAFFLKFSFLENHPANKDWLYIPAESENFEEEVRQFLREIAKGNPLLGTPVKWTANRSDLPEKKILKPKKDTQPKANKKRENGFILNILKKK